MNLDIIVAILGIISAIVGLLTAIIQLKNATHQRRHQESQDDRSYIDIGIGKWLKRALILFGVPFAILLAYREWNWFEGAGWSIKGFADKAITLELKIDSLKERSWENLLLPHTRYKIRVAKGRDYRYTCPGYKSEFYGYAALGDRKMLFPTGEVSFWSSISADNPQKDGGEIIVGESGTIFARFEIMCPGSEQIVQKINTSVQFIPM